MIYIMRKWVHRPMISCAYQHKRMNMYLCHGHHVIFYYENLWLFMACHILNGFGSNFQTLRYKKLEETIHNLTMNKNQMILLLDQNMMQIKYEMDKKYKGHN